MHIFVNRASELRWLESLWQAPGAQMAVVYGRRRVGKTRLLQEFLGGRDHTYLLCTRSLARDQAETSSRHMARDLNEPILRTNPFTSWSVLFDFVADRAARRRLVLVIDEFPLLVQADPSVPSVLQQAWDLRLSKSRVMLVLCGSSLAMMESEVLAAKSPLHGRRTGQWKVAPLGFRDVLSFFPKRSVEEVVPWYAVTGGMPFYLDLLGDAPTVRQAILERVGRRGTVLSEEGEFLLREGVSEPPTYFSILRSVAEGNTRQVEIANSIGIPATGIVRHLETLLRLGLLEREAPVTEKPRTKRTVYGMADPFLRFWFRFIHPNRPSLEAGRLEPLERALTEGFVHQEAWAFERVCREAVGRLGLGGFDQIGRWWGAVRSDGRREIAEIDVVGLNVRTGDLVVGECKWASKVDGMSVLRRLQARAASVDWGRGRQVRHHVVFARSFRHPPMEDPGLLIDCRQLDSLFRTPAASDTRR